MIKSFADRRTEVLFNDEVLKAFEGFARAAKRRLDMLNSAHSLGDLMVPPSNRLERLRGNLKGHHSIRINDRWRIAFRWIDGHAHDVRVMDYH
ncbi:MAG: type II toxin-antitoxin system RelE/ParE family toxin [Alphaproteobacteria bacterium]